MVDGSLSLQFTAGSRSLAHYRWQVDYTEFLAATLSFNGPIAKGSIRQAFGILDADDDGYITRADLSRAFEGGLAERSLGRYLQGADEEGRVRSRRSSSVNTL